MTHLGIPVLVVTLLIKSGKSLYERDTIELFAWWFDN